MSAGTRKIPDYDAKILRMLRAGEATNEQIRLAHGLSTRALARLENKGLIVRRTRDYRHIVYAITAAGIAACPPRNPASALRNLDAATQGTGVCGAAIQRKGGRLPALERFE